MIVLLNKRKIPTCIKKLWKFYYFNVFYCHTI